MDVESFDIVLPYPLLDDFGDELRPLSKRMYSGGPYSSMGSFRSMPSNLRFQRFFCKNIDKISRKRLDDDSSV